MPTEYTHRVSYSCPLAMMDAANEFMAWTGGPGDIFTFRPPVDENGDPAGSYAVASGQYKEDILSRMATEPTSGSRPSWDVDSMLDLALAQQGHAAISFEIDGSIPTTEGLASKGSAGVVKTVLKDVGDPESAPAWEAGLDMKIGDLCADEGTTYMCIQAHTTQSDWPPAVVPALFVVIPADASVWQAGVQYSVDQVVEHEGVTYSCLQAHTSQVGWEPPNVPALWAVA